jgi:hypothetical protein
MYSPNNTSVYLKAFAGFMAGIAAAEFTATKPSAFASYAQMADAYAQELDTAWGTGAPTGLELDEILTASEAVWENRSPLALPEALRPTAYAQIVLSVIARVHQGNAQVVSEGIDPNGGGGSGGGTTSLFIFRPGGTPGGNVYTTEASLSAAIGSKTGATLLFDFGLKAGAVYDFTTVGDLNLGILTNWVLGDSSTGEGGCSLVFEAGTTITRPPASIVSNTVEAVIQINQDATLISTTDEIRMVIDGGIDISLEGDGGFFLVSGDDATIFMRGATTAGGTGSGVVFRSSSGAIQVYLEGTASLEAGGAADTGVGIVVTAPGVSVDSSLYGITFIEGLYVDTTGDGVADISAANSSGQLLFSAGVLYESDGTNWNGIGGGGGGVISVSATAPLTSSGGTTPDIDIEAGSTAGDVIIWSGSDWIIRQLTQDDILPGFTIDSFTVSGGTVEVGATVTNPTITASYSATPASANVTNTASIDSPLDLTTPFTAGTVVGAFTKTSATAVDFTLTAVSTGGVTKTAGAAITWEFRTFAGVGTAGATSATASSTNAVLNGGAGTLPSAGLFGSIVGQAFSLTPASQNCYILTPHTASAHTWKDLNTGLPFAMNAPITFSFTNEEGVASSYDLYQSTNVLSANFDIEAVT